MSTSLKSTADVVAWVRDLTVADLPPAVRQRAGDALLHHAYCGAQGQRLPAPTAASAVTGARPESAAGRALAYGVTAHASLQEDMHVPSVCHIGTVVMPAAQAAATGSRWGGDRLLLGIVAGYEVMGRIGAVVAQAGQTARLRPTGTSGPLGSWAALARIHELDADTSARALGLAANVASGLNGWAWQGGEEVFLHSGVAAQAGVQAVALAQAGYRGSPDVLTGRAGFLEVYGGADAVGRLAAQRWGDASGGWVLEEILFKPHPGCNYVQTVVDTCLALRAGAGVVPEEIAEVEVAVSTPARQYPGCDVAGPWPNRLAAQMSIQFATVATLLDGDYAAALDHPDRWQRYATLASWVRVVADPEIDARYPGRQGARVTVRDRRSEIAVAARDDLTGLTPTAVRDNLRRLGAQYGATPVAEQLIQYAGDLASVPAAEVAAGVAELWRRIREAAVPPPPTGKDGSR